MNVLLGSVGDFSLSQSRENLPHGDVPFPQPITEVRLLEVNLVPVKTNSDVIGTTDGIVERIFKGGYVAQEHDIMSGLYLVNSTNPLDLQGRIVGEFHLSLLPEGRKDRHMIGWARPSPDITPDP